MKQPTPIKDALWQVEVAWVCIEIPPVDRGMDLLRHDFQSAVLALRELITPRGDPLFVQIAASKRALQLVVLAGELLMMRGWPRRGSPEADLMEAALIAAKHVAEEHAR